MKCSARCDTLLINIFSMCEQAENNGEVSCSLRCEKSTHKHRMGECLNVSTHVCRLYVCNNAVPIRISYTMRLYIRFFFFSRLAYESVFSPTSLYLTDTLCAAFNLPFPANWQSDEIETPFRHTFIYLPLLFNGICSINECEFIMNFN